jgi:hypothetical protein
MQISQLAWLSYKIAWRTWLRIIFQTGKNVSNREWILTRVISHQGPVSISQKSWHIRTYIHSLSIHNTDVSEEHRSLTLKMEAVWSGSLSGETNKTLSYNSVYRRSELIGNASDLYSGDNQFVSRPDDRKPRQGFSALLNSPLSLTSCVGRGPTKESCILK